jgi:hypothetical protein
MMMVGKNYCQCCGMMFVPDRRVGLRQKTCSVACRKVRKSESNKRFGRKNPDYWLGRYDVVKAWRKDHPDYQKTWRRKRKERRMALKPGEIQAEMFSKALDTVQENVFLLREIQAKMPFQFTNIMEKLPVYPCRSS